MLRYMEVDGMIHHKNLQVGVTDAESMAERESKDEFIVEEEIRTDEGLASSFARTKNRKRKGMGGPENGNFNYRGVRQRKWSRWVAEIRVPKKRSPLWLGTFETPEAAAEAFNSAALDLYGCNARLNLIPTPTKTPALTTPSLKPLIPSRAALTSAGSREVPRQSELGQVQFSPDVTHGECSEDSCTREGNTVESLSRPADQSEVLDFNGSSLSDLLEPLSSRDVSTNESHTAELLVCNDSRTTSGLEPQIEALPSTLLSSIDGSTSESETSEFVICNDSGTALLEPELQASPSTLLWEPGEEWLHIDDFFPPLDSDVLMFDMEF